MNKHLLVYGLVLFTILLNSCAKSQEINMACGNECASALSQYSSSCMSNCEKRFGRSECNDKVYDDCKEQVEPLRMACLRQCGYTFS